MSDLNDPLAWISKAEEDFTLAQYAIRRRKVLAYSAGFHAQQCAEKYLKAALVSKGLDFPKTHDLLALNSLCVQAGLDLGIGIDELGALSAYAVQFRYPGVDTTPEEARDALEVAKLVRKVIRKWLALK